MKSRVSLELVIGKHIWLSTERIVTPSSFVGTLIANLQKHSIHNHLDEMIQKSQTSAIRTLKSDKAVSLKIDRDLLL